ncbi:TetR/AcrR family transcriptional regulator [Gilvibacter sediminis]|uniref:TetR/AcrR family transcriptional regulator n=1 Tax=Gilvibacter sediminis TaxID=379071 RepID=UPI00234FE9EC|nr:TetR/AcrR family transcriptional regulator [Gilvibacter sediminis]MDC7997877.1 TetR/AcrR family transcriptional regulator [Gilvibacter sediminis]
MLTKAERTSKFIVETVAPIFNQKGYAATSINDLTKATGLTKGAIYGNFESKEALAIAAFKYNVNELFKQISLHQQESDSALGALYKITEFYRSYYQFSRKLGGCPILNVGVDAHHNESPLMAQVQRVISKSQEHIQGLVELAVAEGDLKEEFAQMNFGKLMYTRIQGAIFMMQTMDDHNYVVAAVDALDQLIKNYET